MMTIDPGPDGAETFRLKPTGWGRFFFDIPFLALWLAFWAVFEVAVIVLLGGMVAGVISSAFGVPLSFASRLTPDGSAPFVLLFIPGWLTMWTVGGIAAGTHFLRIVAGRDVISVSPDGLEIERRAGPFRRRRTIKHGDLRGLRINLQGNAVVVDTAAGRSTSRISARATNAPRFSTLRSRGSCCRTRLAEWLSARTHFPIAD